MSVLKIDLTETVTCLHAVPDHIVAATVEGSIFVLKNPANQRHLQTEVVQKYTLPQSQKITAGCVVENEKIIYGDSVGSLHLFHPLEDRTISTRRNNSPDDGGHIRHVTATISNGASTAVTNSAGITKLYSSRDMQHSSTLPGRFPVGVAAAGDFSVYGATGGNAVAVFDLRQTKHAVFSLSVDDCITCLAEACPSKPLGVLGTAGGRCALVRFGVDQEPPQRCYLPGTGMERYDITSVSQSAFGTIVSADANGVVSIVELMTAHVSYRERLEPHPSGAVVLGAQMISENVFAAVTVGRQGSAVRFVSIPTPSSR